MSYLQQAQLGLAAVETRDWDKALFNLSSALRTSPNPTWLIARSKTLLALGRHREALEDANLAWHTAYERNKRNLLVEAHYRRAVAYFRLGELANADLCCIYAMRLVKGHPAVEKEDVAKDLVDETGFWKPTAQEAFKEAQTDKINEKSQGSPLAVGQGAPAQAKEWRMASTLRIQILTAMQKLPADDPARKPTATLKPEKKAVADATARDLKGFTPLPTEAPKPATPQAAPKPVPSDAPLRLQDFQSTTTMSVSIFSKGVNKEKVQVEFLPFQVSLDPIIYPNGEEKEFKLDLWGEIDPSESKYTVTPNKVELSLRKKAAGKWAQLRGAAQPVNGSSVKPDEQQARSNSKDTQAADVTATNAPIPSTTASQHKGKSVAESTSSKAIPSYPTSSKKGPKDWDKIGGDDDEDEAQGDPNHFFKQLFKGATPDQQRAMMKSFTESNGTSLSTDWADVKDRTVETVPPEGIEAKKWGQ
ncbi:hypothetical protein S7711_06978 [Stachybotrys chartarum IBT 7711]|uniref:CS domain-containing protein n=1 Tax=Stachybotrys chartarum (strain CBS 109288 / IBT 7711) TaxID=1280523 RepID=A0A084ARY9_STACB|nr:hypothetical protein S7711_06978 [Stachybotrys chartarum IBT 7711]